MLKRHWWVAIGTIAVASVFVAFQFRGQDKPQYFTAKADRGDIREVVEATGTINAVITVQVGSQVSGNVKELHVDFNSVVKKNQVIARIDPELFQAQVNQAKAHARNLSLAILLSGVSWIAGRITTSYALPTCCVS